MKKLLFAVAGMMAMSPMMGLPQGKKLQPGPKPPPQKNNFTEEDLKKASEKFLLDLEENNVYRKKNFPTWKEYKVYDLTIIASNPKTALKNMHSLLGRNKIAIIDKPTTDNEKV